MLEPRHLTSNLNNLYSLIWDEFVPVIRRACYFLEEHPMKKLVTVKLPLAACLISLSCSALTQEMQEVIITASLIDASSDAISNPLHVVSGESIATDASQSIGASIDGLVGVSSSDYGAAVGQPIIRGMSGSPGEDPQ